MTATQWSWTIVSIIWFIFIRSSCKKAEKEFYERDRKQREEKRRRIEQREAEKRAEWEAQSARYAEASRIAREREAKEKAAKPKSVRLYRKDPDRYLGLFTQHDELSQILTRLDECNAELEQMCTATDNCVNKMRLERGEVDAALVDCSNRLHALDDKYREISREADKIYGFIRRMGQPEN